MLRKKPRPAGTRPSSLSFKSLYSPVVPRMRPSGCRPASVAGAAQKRRRPEGRLPGVSMRRSDVEHRHDAQRARLDHDDLVTRDEVHVAAPFRLDLDDRGRERGDAYGPRHGNADPEIEVDMLDPRRARGQHFLPYRRLLLGGERDVLRGHRALVRALLGAAARAAALVGLRLLLAA